MASDRPEQIGVVVCGLSGVQEPTQSRVSNQRKEGGFGAGDKILENLHNLLVFFPGSYLPPFMIFSNKNRQILTHTDLGVNFHFVTYSGKEPSFLNLRNSGQQAGYLASR